MKIIPFALFLSITFGLVGCDQTKTEEWYMSHPDEMVNTYIDCWKTKTFSSERCVPVVNAVNRSDSAISSKIAEIQHQTLREQTKKGD